MGTNTSIKDVRDEDLDHELDIAYGDLCYVLARIIAVRQRMDPTESKLNVLGWTLGYAGDQLGDEIIHEADSMLASRAGRHSHP